MRFREHEIDFREADRRYGELKRRFDAGIISAKEFDAQRSRLMVQDDEGRWWAKGRKDGEWAYRTEGGWVRGTPPGYEPQSPSQISPALQNAPNRRAPALRATPPDSSSTRDEERPIRRRSGRGARFSIGSGIIGVLLAVGLIAGVAVASAVGLIGGGSQDEGKLEAPNLPDTQSEPESNSEPEAASLSENEPEIPSPPDTQSEPELESAAPVFKSTPQAPQSTPQAKSETKTESASKAPQSAPSNPPQSEPNVESEPAEAPQVQGASTEDDTGESGIGQGGGSGSGDTDEGVGSTGAGDGSGVGGSGGGGTDSRGTGDGEGGSGGGEGGTSTGGGSETGGPGGGGAGEGGTGTGGTGDGTVDPDPSNGGLP